MANSKNSSVTNQTAFLNASSSSSSPSSSSPTSSSSSSSRASPISVYSKRVVSSLKMANSKNSSVTNQTAFLNASSSSSSPSSTSSSSSSSSSFLPSPISVSSKTVVISFKIAYS